MPRERSRAWARLIAAALAAFTSTANADWYSCRDPQYGGDSPPAECKVEICVTKANGDRKCTQPPETPEQRKKHEEREKRQHECEKKALDKRRDDIRFEEKYKTEEDIQKERDRALTEQQQIIDDAKQRLEGYKTEKAKLADEKEFHEGPKNPMSEDLRLDIESNKKVLDQQQSDLEKARKGMQEINDRYDALLKRHRDLLQNGVRTVPCDAEE